MSLRNFFQAYPVPDVVYKNGECAFSTGHVSAVQAVGGGGGVGITVAQIVQCLAVVQARPPACKVLELLRVKELWVLE